jgi:hypothetical protein
MVITYSDHAVSRMMERTISVSDVTLILSHPDGKIKQSADKWIFYKHLSSRKDNLVAAVAVEKKGNSWEIVTVMINFEVKK